MTAIQYYASLDDITHALYQADVILTPTKRLARYVEHYYYQQLQDTVFHYQPIESLDGWLYQLWHELSLQQAHPPALLTNWQQYYYWAQCLNALSPTPLLNHQTTLQNLLQAWRLVNEWSLDIDDIEQQAFNDDQQLMVNCIHAYQQWRSNQHYIDLQQLPAWLLQHLTADIVQQHNQLVLLDFNYTTLPPIYQQLLEQFQQLGGQVSYYQRYQQPPALYYYEAGDSEQELQHIIQGLEQATQQQPQAQCLWVVPDLNSRRQQLSHYINQSTINSHAVNIGGYEALADIAIIQTALNIIHLKQASPISRHVIDSLLSSPYIGEQSSFCSDYAIYRHALMKQLPPDISVTQWRHFLSEQPAAISCYFQQLADYELPEQASPEQWASHLYALLQLMGWPGQRPLNSMEYQAIQTWHQVFDELCSLTQIADNSWSLATAYQWLTYIAYQTPYQPQSSDRIQIDCLEPMEAVGLPYDAIWIMDTHQKAWPASHAMNPFLPFQLQRHYNLPHASTEREQQFYTVLIEQLLSAAPCIQLSYARQQPNEDQCHLSLLWAYHQPVLIQPNPASTTHYFQATRSLSIVWDQQAPSVDNPDSIRGGSSLLKTQALCPFKAWAQYRLAAEPDSTRGYLIDAKEKGILLHKALEYLWQHWRDQNELLQTDSAELDRLIHQALYRATGIYKDRLPSRLLQGEIERLQAHIKQWLDYEKQRPFFSIQALEKATTLTIAQLPIQLKIDRIDQDAAGQTILIDYKTNAPTPKRWQDERLEEPQMPLYALSQSQASLSAVTYAQIKAQHIRFVGWSNAQTLPDCRQPPQDWDQLRQDWQHHLNQLAQQFTQGHSQLDPKHGLQTCQQCHLTSVCRRLDSIEADST